MPFPPAPTDAPADDAGIATDAPPPDAMPEGPAAQTLSLTPDQATGAGLDNLSPGDRFSVTITGTVDSADPDTGITATIDGASEGKHTPDEGAKSPADIRMKGPKDLGLDEESEPDQYPL